MLLNKKIPFGYILRKVRNELPVVFLLSLIVLLLTDRFDERIPEMPLTIPVFLGTAISVLLSFKLNQSYDRWWEARKIWGSVVNDSRTLVIQMMSFIGNGNQELIKQIALRQVAWCYTLGQSLRGLDPTDNLDRLMTEDDLKSVLSHQNKALAIIQLHGKDFKTLKEKGHLELFAQIQLDDTLVRLVENQGKAERIKNTVFPVTYRLFLHAIIYLFVVTLSISLKNIGGVFEIPLLVLISVAFFLLEKSATHMQDPFENRPTDTPVTAIANTIEMNIRQLLNEKNVAQPAGSNTFYQL